MTIEALYERLFDLRAAQANCTAGERASYEHEIASILDRIAFLGY